MKILRKIYFGVDFFFFYLWKLVQSNFYIAWDIITPTMHTEPEFVDIPLSLKSTWGLLLFSNLLSMTPGTLSVDMSRDRRMLQVHVLYKRDELITFGEINRIQEKIKRFAK